MRFPNRDASPQDSDSRIPEPQKLDSASRRSCCFRDCALWFLRQSSSGCHHVTVDVTQASPDSSTTSRSAGSGRSNPVPRTVRLTCCQARSVAFPRIGSWRMRSGLGVPLSPWSWIPGTRRSKPVPHLAYTETPGEASQRGRTNPMNLRPLFVPRREHGHDPA